MKWKDLLGGSKSKVDEINVPDFKPDPYIGKTQDFLFPYSQSLLEGKPNDYYAPIGEIGGATFENYLQQNINDIVSGVNASAAGKNIGGGRLAESTAKQVASITPALRYQDLLKGIEGRKFLMGTGLNTMEGVRTGALNLTGMENNYNLDATKMRMSQAEYMDKFNEQQRNNLMKTISSGIAIAAAPFTGGASLGLLGIGGLGGGTTGSTMGSAAGGVDISSLYKSGGFNLATQAGGTALSSGSLASLAGLCWVAKEVFGSWEDERTQLSRFYIINLAPRWFFRFYKKNGKKIAQYIHDKQILKNLIKPLFNYFVNRAILYLENKKELLCQI